MALPEQKPYSSTAIILIADVSSDSMIYFSLLKWAVYFYVINSVSSLGDKGAAQFIYSMRNTK